MRHPAIESLLILQDREQSRRTVQQQLDQVPGEVARVQAKIDAEKQAIDAAKAEWQELESKKKLLETEIGSAEAKLAKYRTQQSLVKKNDEYQALGHEIETMSTTVGGMEEQELEIMYAIDAAKSRFVAAEAELKTNIAGHEASLGTLAQRQTNLADELSAAESEVSTAREPITEKFLRVFDRIAERQFPACAAVVGGNCSGCHLKVSGENESVARKGEELATCDQCGRIIWWESS